MKGSIVSCRHLLTSVCFTLGPSRSFRTPPTQMCLAGNSRGPILQTHTTNDTTLLFCFFLLHNHFEGMSLQTVWQVQRRLAQVRRRLKIHLSQLLSHRKPQKVFSGMQMLRLTVCCCYSLLTPPGGTAADVFLISHAGCGAAPGRRRSCCSRGGDPSCSADLRQTHHQHRDDCGGGLKPACLTLRSHREVVRRGGCLAAKRAGVTTQDAPDWGWRRAN